MPMTRLPLDGTMPPSWPSAGIADARAFRVGESATVHEPTHFSPIRVRGRCGIVAAVRGESGPLAAWADAFPTCSTCIARKARP